jgi:microsomal epoxide hydrolase
MLIPAVNFCSIGRPEKVNDDSALSKVEKDNLGRWETWKATGQAYALEHATKPATIGFVLSSSPLALLSWYGSTV